MIENQAQSVSAAFEILLEELEAEVELVNKIGAKAFDSQNYEQAQEALSRGVQITALRDRVAALRTEWQALELIGTQLETPATKAKRQHLGKLRKGLRTPEGSYWVPILQSLIEMGGTASIGDVLDRVYEKMKPSLNEYDLQPLASDPTSPRWRNAAEWARNTMVNEGLLRSDSPRGQWEITSLGREWLKSRQA